MMRRLATVAMVVLALFALGGCARGTHATTHAAATTVGRLLELRSTGSTDTSAYEPFFANAALAEQLAGSAVSGKRAVPQWRTPYVSELTSGTAEVVVKWSEDVSGFPGWPSATIFVLERSAGKWVVVDAVDPSGTAPGPLSDAKIARVAAETVDK